MAKREALQPGVVISVVGPTASGKTEVAIALAQKLHTEIVNADARQIYRGMSIGTAQPTAEERHAIPHHFVDFLSPNELYSAGAFEKAAVPQLTNLCSTYGSAVLAGGSGMYVKATLQGLDELPSDADLREELNAKVQDGGLPSLVAQLQKLDAKHAANMDTSNPQRVVRALEVCITSGQPFSSFHTGKAKTRPWHVVSIGLQPDREELRKRIAKRAHAMIKAGWLEETRALLPSSRHECVEHAWLQRVVSTSRWLHGHRRSNGTRDYSNLSICQASNDLVSKRPKHHVVCLRGQQQGTKVV